MQKIWDFIQGIPGAISKGFTNLIDLIRELPGNIRSTFVDFLDAINAIPGAILSFFTIDFAVVSAELSPMVLSFKNKFKDITDILDSFSNLDAGTNTKALNMVIEMPNVFEKDKTFTLNFDLSKYSDAMSKVREFTSAMLWISFGWNLISIIRVRFVVD